MPSWLFATAQTHIGSSLAGTLNSLTPLFTLIIGILFFKLKTRWYNILGVLIGLSGAIGLIMANIVKMICRIFVCLVFYLKPYMMENNITITNVDGTTRNFQLNDLFPKLPVFIVFAISFVMTQISSKFIYQNEIRIISFNSIGHLVIGMLFFLFTSFVCWKYHGVELKAAFVAGRKKKKE